jgi:hypothetical protein
LKPWHFRKRSEIPGNFLNVVLEKDGGDELDQSSEKWRSNTSNTSPGKEVYPTKNKKKKSA